MPCFDQLKGLERKKIMLNFTLTQLEYIVAVDTHRNFVAAAEASHVTQPTLSMQIKKLENQLGVVIFDRSKQPVVPTDAGKEILTHARNLLREAGKIPESVQARQGSLAGEFKLAIIPTLAPYLLPRFIGNFLRTYPGINIQVRELTTASIIQALNRDQVDAGILVTPLNEHGIEEWPLFYEGFTMYVGPRHPMRSQEEIPQNRLKEEPIWLLSTGHCFRSQAVNLCATGNMPPTPLSLDYTSGSLETLVRIVDREGGSTLLPELAAHEILPEQHPGLKTIGPPMPVREVSLVHSRNLAKRRMLEALKTKVRDSVPESMLELGERNIVEWR